MPVHGWEIVDAARLLRGCKYKFGAEVANGEMITRDPFKVGLDCSELVEYVLARLGWFQQWETPIVFDGSYNQYAFCKKAKTLIDLDDARGISGALVFRRDSETGQIEHVAFTTDINTTIEARGKDYGTGEFEWRPNWTHGAMIPGVIYAKT